MTGLPNLLFRAASASICLLKAAAVDAVRPKWRDACTRALVAREGGPPAYARDVAEADGEGYAATHEVDAADEPFHGAAVNLAAVELGHFRLRDTKRGRNVVLAHWSHGARDFGGELTA